jgi:hypothetical protein
MPVLTLALVLLLQGPQDVSTDPAPEALRVEGTLELSRGEAEAAAWDAARRACATRMLARGNEIAAQLAPFWLPDVVVRKEVEEWTRKQERAHASEIVHRETRVRRYSYGEAFQTTLWLADDTKVSRDAEGRLERQIREAGELLLAKAGGIAVFWGLLAFVCSWFDRLTRGYMTWRLRLIAAGLGLSVPTLVLLL